MEQRTEEWFKARLGKVGASMISAVMAKTKAGYSATRDNYMADLIVQKLTGESPDGFSSAAMQWGTEQESNAKAAYEFMNDVAIEDVGFILHPEIDQAGASPDGLIGPDGLIEIKCPNTATHIKTLLSGKVDRKYVLQMQWQMACSGRDWCEFMSYDPRMPADLSMWTKRVDKDPELIQEITDEVNKFLSEMKGKLTELEAISNG